MEQFLDASLRGWRLELQRTIRAEPRAEWDGMDTIQLHWQTNCYWRTLKRLGSGAFTFGDVFRQVCELGKSRHEVRAVKRIGKTQAENFLKTS